MRPLRLSLRVFLLSVFCLAFFGSQNTKAEQREEESVCFRWAFGAMVGPENDRRLVAITRDTKLKTGDQLKMLVELRKKCFVYLIYHSAEDELRTPDIDPIAAVVSAASFYSKTFTIEHE